MLIGQTRAPFRRSTTLSKTQPKGYLKIVRERIKQEAEAIHQIKIEENLKQHSHKRSQSTNNFPFSIKSPKSPGSPSIKFIQKPLGDF